MDAIIYKDTIYGGGGAMRGNYFNPIIYSTEERVVGVWVDNKPLYQKTIVFGSITNRSSISIGVANVEHISLVPDGSWVNDGERPLPYVIGSDASNNIGGYFTIGTSDTSFDVRMGNGSASDSRNGAITVQYTKTTDVAGSGAYTTLGIPAVHYSTDEQVIGTWFGETLYQKIVSFDNVTINANGFASYQLSQYINNLNHAIFHKTVAITTGGYSELPSVHVGEISGYAWSSAMNNNELYISRGNASGVTADYKVVVEYTKST